MASETPLSDVRFLTVAEVATIMRVSKMTVYRLVHSGELEAIRVGRSFRVPEPPQHRGYVLGRPIHSACTGVVGAGRHGDWRPPHLPYLRHRRTGASRQWSASVPLAGAGFARAQGPDG